MTSIFKKEKDKMWKSNDKLAYLRMIDQDTELIPLMTNEDDDSLRDEDIPALIPILPLRNTVLFPGVVIPITVGRDKSIKLIRDANKGNKIIGVTTQIDGSIEDPEAKDLNPFGTVAQILKMLRMPDGNTTVIIHGKKRFHLKEMVSDDPYFKGNIELIPDLKPLEGDKEFHALVSTIRDLAINIVQNSPQIPQEAGFAIRNIESPSFLVNFISSNMNLAVAEKQQLLEMADLKHRATTLLLHLNKEHELMELKNQIQNKVRTDIDKQQKEYFLHQQMRMIQEELGNSEAQQVKELREKATKKKWGEKEKENFDKEVGKLERMNPMVAEYSVQMNYLEFMVELPWNEYTEDRFDLKSAKKILDRDHSGLDKIKERIIEHLAVLKLKGDMKAPILCLVGPPGVGKTSLGK